jgi:hypothetical protein
MPSNSETIISNQAHVGDDAVQTHTGTKFKGDGYYGRSDGFHTIQIDLNGFLGKIEIQGTLAVNPVEADWFTMELGTGSQSVDTTGLITEQNITYVEYVQSTTNVKAYNFTSNSVWIRASITNWTAGTLNSIRLNH